MEGPHRTRQGPSQGWVGLLLRYFIPILGEIILGVFFISYKPVYPKSYITMQVGQKLMAVGQRIMTTSHPDQLQKGE